MNHSSLDSFQPVIGFIAAGIGTVAVWTAGVIENISPVSRGWVELGGTLGLIGGLAYGCRTLWIALMQERKDIRDERKEFIAAKDALEKEIRNDWKEQNDKLIAVLDRLDKSTK